MKKKKQKTRGSGSGGPKRAYRTLAYPVEFRLRMVKLYLEEGYSTKLLREQFDVSGHSIQRWARAYRLQGLFWRPPVEAYQARAAVDLSLDPGPCAGDLAPGGRPRHNAHGMARVGQTVDDQKWPHQNREGGICVTQFSEKIVP